jgi:hypothetical protein
VNGIDARAQVLESTLLVCRDEHHEGVALARRVLTRWERREDTSTVNSPPETHLLLLQKALNELRGIGNEMVKVLVNGEDGEDSVATNLRGW